MAELLDGGIGMATEIKIWEIEGQKISPVEDTPLAAQHLEEELETWITQAPGILGEELLVIDRQRDIPGVGRLDLLCIDVTGKLVVVELKRDRSAREAVAQALDYASWLNDAASDELLANAKQYLKADLSEVFESSFGVEMPSELLPQNHKLVIVASRLDASAERIVNYLRDRHAVEFNVVLLKYARVGGEHEVLVRTHLLPESTGKPSGEGAQPSVESLLGLAKERHVEVLVEACRALQEIWDERPRRTYGGSFRYKDRTIGNIVFGANVAGARKNSPDSKLDVWVRVGVLSEITGIPKERISQQLREDYSVIEVDKWDDAVVRLSSLGEAERLINQLKEWARQGQAKS